MDQCSLNSGNPLLEFMQIRHWDPWALSLLMRDMNMLLQRILPLARGRCQRRQTLEVDKETRHLKGGDRNCCHGEGDYCNIQNAPAVRSARSEGLGKRGFILQRGVNRGTKNRVWRKDGHVSPWEVAWWGSWRENTLSEPIRRSARKEGLLLCQAGERSKFGGLAKAGNLN